MHKVGADAICSKREKACAPFRCCECSRSWRASRVSVAEREDVQPRCLVEIEYLARGKAKITRVIEVGADALIPKH